MVISTNICHDGRNESDQIHQNLDDSKRGSKCLHRRRVVCQLNRFRKRFEECKV